MLCLYSMSLSKLSTPTKPPAAPSLVASQHGASPPPSTSPPTATAPVDSDRKTPEAGGTGDAEHAEAHTGTDGVDALNAPFETLSLASGDENKGTTGHTPFNSMGGNVGFEKTKLGNLATPGPIPTSIEQLISGSAHRTEHPRTTREVPTIPDRLLSPSRTRQQQRHTSLPGFDLAASLSDNDRLSRPRSQVSVEQDDKQVVVHVNSNGSNTKVPRLPNYGGTAQEDLDSWLDRVYTTQALRRWSDKDAFDNAVLHLIGDAWNEFRVHKSEMSHSIGSLSVMLRKRLDFSVCKDFSLSNKLPQKMR